MSTVCNAYLDVEGRPDPFVCELPQGHGGKYHETHGRNGIPVRWKK